jgi:hypothetical protein
MKKAPRRCAWERGFLDAGQTGHECRATVGPATLDLVCAHDISVTPSARSVSACLSILETKKPRLRGIITGGAA